MHCPTRRSGYEVPAAVRASLLKVVSSSVAFSALSACWSVEDGENPALAIAVARMASVRNGNRLEGRRDGR